MSSVEASSSPSVVTRFSRLVTDPQSDRTWLAAVLLLALAGGIGIVAPGLLNAATVQDDARQFLFWMARWDDPALFRGDLLADYWQSVSPWLFTGVYRVFHALGVAPVDTALILPVLLMPAVAFFGFRFALAMSGGAYSAFLATLMLLVVLAAEDVIVSSTPRAFAPLFFMMFLDGAARRRSVVVAAALVCLGGTYPQLVPVCVTVLGLSSLRWRAGPRIDLSHGNVVLLASGVSAAVIGILPFVLQTDRFGPTVNVATAKQFPVFLAGGRNSLFEPDGSIDFACGHAVGLIPGLPGCHGFGSPLFWLITILALSPVAALLVLHLRGRLKAAAALPAMVAVAGLLWTTLAALVPFVLHQPNRYAVRSIPYVVVLSLGVLAGRALRARLIDAPHKQALRIFAANAATLLVVLAAYYAAIALLAPGYFRTWRHPQLVNLLADIPPGTSVAGTDMDDLDFIPLLARRPVLFSREHAVAYQLGYYRQIEARMRDIADVELSSDPSVVADRLQRNHIALYLTAAKETGDRVISPTVGSFVGEPYVAALRQQVDGGRSVLSRLAPGCTKERVGPYRLLDANCLIAEARRSQ